MTDSLADAAAKLAKVADELSGQGLHHIHESAGRAAKRDAESALDSDLSGRKFTNWEPVLSVGLDVDTNGATLHPEPFAPWKVLSIGRTPGQKFSAKRGQNVGWGATKGKGTWAKASEAVADHTPRLVDEEVQNVLRGVYG